jgi:hypothetical protein
VIERGKVATGLEATCDGQSMTDRITAALRPSCFRSRRPCTTPYRWSQPVAAAVEAGAGGSWRWTDGVACTRRGADGYGQPARSTHL